MRKKLSLFLLSTLFVLSTITGCSKENDSANSTDNTERPQGEEIVTTTTEEGFVYDKDGDFYMMVDDVFTITGQGTVVTGFIQRGTVKVGDTVELLDTDNSVISTTVVKIEKFREEVDEAYPEENVGIYLEGVGRSDVERGMAVCAPGTIKAHSKFKAEITIYEEAQSESDDVLLADTLTDLVFWWIDTSGTVTLDEGITSIKKGETATITITLTAPMIMHEGTPFTVNSGTTELGDGTVIELLD